MSALPDYEASLAANIVQLQTLLTRQQYVAALACIDERLVIISSLTDFAKNNKVMPTEVAALAGDQLVKEQELRSLVESLQQEIMMQLVTINKTNKIKSTYNGNR